MRCAGSDRDGASCRCAAPSSGLHYFRSHCLDIWAGERLSPLLQLSPITVLKWHAKSPLESEQSVGCGVCLHIWLLRISLPFEAEEKQGLWAYVCVWLLDMLLGIHWEPTVHHFPIPATKWGQLPCLAWCPNFWTYCSVFLTPFLLDFLLFCTVLLPSWCELKRGGKVSFWVWFTKH